MVLGVLIQSMIVMVMVMAVPLKGAATTTLMDTMKMSVLFQCAHIRTIARGF